LEFAWLTSFLDVGRENCLFGGTPFVCFLKQTLLLLFFVKIINYFNLKWTGMEERLI